MGSFACRCGYSIPLKNIPEEASAKFMTDADEAETTGAIAMELAGFINAIAKGERDAWIRSVLPEAYVEFEDRSIISDLLSMRLSDKGRSLIECSACGRIYIESKNHTGYLGFRPEPIWVPASRTFEQSGDAGFVVRDSKSLIGALPERFPTPEEIFIEPFIRGEYGSLIHPEPVAEKPQNLGEPPVE